MQSQAITATQDRLKAMHTAFFLGALTLLVIMLLPSLVYAQPRPATTAMGNVLCAVVGMIYGNLGRGLATLAVAIVGVGATLGKVSWGLAITVAVGIAIIFNADTIVSQLGANINSACTTRP